MDKRVCIAALGACAAVVAALVAVIAFGYNDAALGRKTKAAIRKSMTARGARVERGAYVGGPLKPGVRVHDAAIADALVNTFMERLDEGARERAAAETAAAPPRTPRGKPDEDQDASAMAVGMPRTRPPVAMSPYDNEDGDHSAPIDPEEQVRAYESSASRRRPQRGDGDSDGDEPEDLTYKDPVAARMGAPPPFPDTPINTCVRAGEGDDVSPLAVGSGGGGRRGSKRASGPDRVRSPSVASSSSSATVGSRHRHGKHRHGGSPALGPLQTKHGHRVRHSSGGGSPPSDTQAMSPPPPPSSPPPPEGSEEYDLGGSAQPQTFSYNPDA